MRQPAHLNGCARRQTNAEIVVPDVDMLENSSMSVTKVVVLTRSFSVAPAAFERAFEVFTDLFDLHAHVAGPDNFALVVARQLSGDENHFSPEATTTWSTRRVRRHGA